MTLVRIRFATKMDVISEGKIKNGYALVPIAGHHAIRETGKGFCLFNNIAIAAEYCRKKLGYKKVAIVE